MHEETITAESLLDGDGIRFMFTTAVQNFNDFGVVAVILVAMIGVGVAEEAGLIAALIRKMVKVAPKGAITFIIVLLGGISSVASDAGYLVLIPLGAAAFASSGDIPLAGIAAAYAGVSAAFFVNILITPADGIITEVTNETVALRRPRREPQRHPQLLLQHRRDAVLRSGDDGDHRAPSRTQARQVRPGRAPSDAPVDHQPSDEEMALESRGLRWSVYYLLVAIAIVSALTFIPGAPLRNPETGEIFGNSPFMSSLLFIISMLFLAAGLGYGRGAKSLTGSTNVINAIVKTFNGLGGLIFLMLLIAQFIAYFNYTNMSTLAATGLADLLERADIGALPLLIGFILLVVDHRPDHARRDPEVGHPGADLHPAVLPARHRAADRHRGVPGRRRSGQRDHPADGLPAVHRAGLPEVPEIGRNGHRGVDDGDATATDEVAVTVRQTAETVVRVPTDYATIQAALNAAPARALVLVAPGTYRENIVVPRTLTLASTYYTTGDQSAVAGTVIAGASATTDTVLVSSAAGPETRIVGFTVRDGNDGIEVGGRAVVEHNVISSGTDGVDFPTGSAGLVHDNVLRGNGDDGVDINHSSVVITDNLMQAVGGDGVEARLTDVVAPLRDVVIRGNRIEQSHRDGLQVIDDDATTTTAKSATLVTIDRNIITGAGRSGIGLLAGGNSSEDYSGGKPGRADHRHQQHLRRQQPRDHRRRQPRRGEQRVRPPRRPRAEERRRCLPGGLQPVLRQRRGQHRQQRRRRDVPHRRPDARRVLRAPPRQPGGRRGHGELHAAQRGGRRAGDRLLRDRARHRRGRVRRLRSDQPGAGGRRRARRHGHPAGVGLGGRHGFRRLCRPAVLSP